MARNPYRSTRGETPDYGDVTLQKKGKKWTLSFKPNADGLETAKLTDRNFVAPREPILLAQIDDETSTIELFPLNTTRAGDGLFKPKYSKLRSITFEGKNLWMFNPEDMEGVETYFSKLPAGFVRSPEAGFGIDYELRSIVDALEKADIDGLIVRSGRRIGLPMLSSRKYVISARGFDELRKTVRRIHDTALLNARIEKNRIAHNELLTSIDSVLFPEKPPVYRPNGITALIKGRPVDDFSATDQVTVLTTAATFAENYLTRNKDKILQLNRTIETVTLEVLIEQLRTMIENKSSESRWQSFFVDNPFVLRLAFGYPVVQMGSQVSVGGGRFQGTGSKIADFVQKAVATGNLTIVEIKTGETPILEKFEYRGNLYGPHRELTGAVNQVLDQRYLLQKELSNLKENSGDYEVEGYAVRGIVIAGQIPSERNKKKSFEFFRQNLRWVDIITFDELLQKLEHLADFIRAPDRPAVGSDSPRKKDDPESKERAKPDRDDASRETDVGSVDTDGRVDRA